MLKKLISALLCVSVLSVSSAFAYDIQKPYRIEHLPDYKKANTTAVKITADEAVVMPNNVLQITFNSYFNSKNAQRGDFVDFSLKNGLTTVEGTCILPPGTVITGCILRVEKPKKFNKNAKVYIGFNEAVLPDGTTVPMKAVPLNKVLKATKWQSAGKVALYTVGLFGVGAGAGAWIGAAAHHAGKGALAFGMPIGAGVGLIIGFVTPGLHYRAKAGKKIYIKLTDCLVVENNSASEE